MALVIFFIIKKYKKKENKSLREMEEVNEKEKDPKESYEEYLDSMSRFIHQDPSGKVFKPNNTYQEYSYFKESLIRPYSDSSIEDSLHPSNIISNPQFESLPYPDRKKNKFVSLNHSSNHKSRKNPISKSNSNSENDSLNKNHLSNSSLKDIPSINKKEYYGNSPLIEDVSFLSSLSTGIEDISMNLSIVNFYNNEKTNNTSSVSEEKQY